MFLGIRGESLSWERAADEVHQDVTKRPQITATRLFNTDMSIDRRITGSSCQVLVLTVGNVLVRFEIAVLFRETEVNNVNDRWALAKKNQEVVRFDITRTPAYCKATNNCLRSSRQNRTHVRVETKLANV